MQSAPLCAAGKDPVTPRFTRIAVTAVVVAVSLGLAPSAFAVPEDGDAGDLPSTAQNLGAGSVSEVYGSFTGGGDVDVYRVCLGDGGSFSARTLASPEIDTQLFLFDSHGLGVYSNDDAGLGMHVSRLPAHHRFSPAAPGEYFVGVSSFNNDPQSAAGEIFPDLFSSDLYPDGVVDAAGVGGEEPVNGWSGPTRGPVGFYLVNLSGITGCDKTAPTVNLRSPADGVRVKQGAELRVDFSCRDEGESGLASCVGSVADGGLLDTSRLGEVSVTVTARDRAGNQTVVTNTATVVDLTKPTISVAAPAEGASYEVGERVLADYSCADEPNGSGVDSCEGSVADGSRLDTGSPGENTFTVTATDRAGNTESKGVTYTVVDTKPPAINLTTPAAGAVYGLGQPVAADYSCADRGAGVASCVGSVADGAAVNTASPGEKTFTVNARDRAGNSASKTVTYSVVDSDAPTITVVRPAEGGVYRLGERVLANYSCADEPNGSGVASCVGSVAVGGALDTSAVGPKRFQVRASDNAGNSASRTVAYSVVYDFAGFMRPLEKPPSVNRSKAGLRVPVRFSLGSFRGPVPVASGYPKVARVACGTGALPGGSERARGSWKKTQYPKRDRWIYKFVWRTEKRWSGECRQLVLKLDDGTVHRVELLLVRRGYGRDEERDSDDDDG
jgi:hypothetical protein